MQRERKPKNFLPKATYKGGSKAMSAFIAEHLKYPKLALKNKVEGTVVLRLSIDYKGKVIRSQIKSGLRDGCNEEAQRVVSLLEFDVETKVRRGKILFHKNINIHFRLPPSTQAPKKEESTHLTYTITTIKSSAKKPSYNYTININPTNNQ